MIYFVIRINSRTKNNTTSIYNSIANKEKAPPEELR